MHAYCDHLTGEFALAIATIMSVRELLDSDEDGGAISGDELCFLSLLDLDVGWPGHGSLIPAQRDLLSSVPGLKRGSSAHR